jgi:hypothetical protein
LRTRNRSCNEASANAKTVGNWPGRREIAPHSVQLIITAGSRVYSVGRDVFLIWEAHAGTG